MSKQAAWPGQEARPEVGETASQAREVHVLMNDNRGRFAVDNARDFQGLLGKQAPIAEDAQPSLGL